MKNTIVKLLYCLIAILLAGSVFASERQTTVINTFHTGIAIYDAADVSMETLDLTVINTVTGNKFNEWLPYDADQYGRDALDFENSVFSSINLTVQNNKAYNTVNGIHLRGISGGMVNSTDGTIENGNMVRYSLPPADIPNNYQHGIWLDNCGKVNIANNAVEWVDANSSAPDGTMLENMKGICLEASISCTVSENVVANIEAGINVWGDCTGSELFCNDMVGCYNGVYLDPNAGGSSIIGVQGVVGGTQATNETWKNKWEGNIANNKVDGWALFITWVYDPSLGSDFDPQPSASFVNPIAGDLQNSCTVYDPNGHMNAMARNNDYGRAVGDSSVGDDEDSLVIIYSGKETFYKSAKRNSDLLSLGVASDSVYHTEFDSLEQTNIGKYETVKESLAMGDNSSALSMLASIVDENLMEENKKYVASVIANHYSPYLDADSDTVASLHTIAFMHPFYGGEAVYWARAILHINVHDVMPAMRKAHYQTAPPASLPLTNTDKLNPNPANNSVSLGSNKDFADYDIMCVYNFLQQKIIELKLPGGSKVFTFDSSDLGQGIYFVRHFSSGSVVSENKLVIIK